MSLLNRVLLMQQKVMLIFLADLLALVPVWAIVTMAVPGTVRVTAKAIVRVTVQVIVQVIVPTVVLMVVLGRWNGIDIFLER